jgi:hypothetical protein
MCSLRRFNYDNPLGVSLERANTSLGVRTSGERLMVQVTVCSFCYLFLWLQRGAQLSDVDMIAMEAHVKKEHNLQPYHIDN